VDLLDHLAVGPSTGKVSGAGAGGRVLALAFGGQSR